MKEHQNMFAIEKMSRVFNISRSSYYDWLTRKPSARTISNQETLKLIQEVYSKSKKRYGSPKITIELRKNGVKISRPRVARLMRTAGIRSIVHKRFRVQTTDSNHNYPVAKNLLDRNRPPPRFAPEKIGKAWVSDITGPRGRISKPWKAGYI